MCIIIVNQSGTLPYSVFKNSWDNNPDGAGLMYAKNNKLHIFKEMYKKKIFYDKYKEIRESFAGIIVLHFRIGTSGRKDINNTHPFFINENFAFCHNGIIQHTTEREGNYSDTVLFNERILKKLPAGFLSKPGIYELIVGYIGYSKLAFLDNKGICTLVNATLGHWDKDKVNWYSNHTYEPPAPVAIGFEDNRAWVKKYYFPTSANVSHKGENKVSLTCEVCGKRIYSPTEQGKGMCWGCISKPDNYNFLD